MPAFSESKVVRAFLFSLPFVTALCFLALEVFVWPIPFWGQIAPSLGLSAIFYWSIYRPDLMRPFAVFLLGLLSDGIHGFPLGLSPLAFLIVHQLAYSQRRFFVGQVFFMLWFGLAVAALIAGFVFWLFMSFAHFEFEPIIPVTMQVALTIVAFPLPAWLLIRLQRALLSQV